MEINIHALTNTEMNSRQIKELNVTHETVEKGEGKINLFLVDEDYFNKHVKNIPKRRAFKHFTALSYKRCYL